MISKFWNWLVSFFCKEEEVFCQPFISYETFVRNSKVYYRLGHRKWVHHVYDAHGRHWTMVKSSSIKRGKAEAKRQMGKIMQIPIFAGYRKDYFTIKLEGLR